MAWSLLLLHFGVSFTKTPTGAPLPFWNRCWARNLWPCGYQTTLCCYAPGVNRTPSFIHCSPQRLSAWGPWGAHSTEVVAKSLSRDFAGGPVVKTSPSNAGHAGSIPGRGTKIPHASWPKNQNRKQKQCGHKCNMVCLHMVYIKLPRWYSGWESPCRCRGHELDPQSWRIPRAVQQRSLCAQTLKPSPSRLRSAAGDATTARRPHIASRQTPVCNNKDPAQPRINKQTKWSTLGKKKKNSVSLIVPDWILNSGNGDMCKNIQSESKGLRNWGMGDMQGSLGETLPLGLSVFSIIAECHMSFLLKAQDRYIQSVRESLRSLPQSRVAGSH